MRLLREQYPVHETGLSARTILMKDACSLWHTNTDTVIIFKKNLFFPVSHIKKVLTAAIVPSLPTVS